MQSREGRLKITHDAILGASLGLILTRTLSPRPFQSQKVTGSERSRGICSLLHRITDPQGKHLGTCC